MSNDLDYDNICEKVGRDKAVREEKFLCALIYDAIHNEAQLMIEEGE